MTIPPKQISREKINSSNLENINLIFDCSSNGPHPRVSKPLCLFLSDFEEEIKSEELGVERPGERIVAEW